jgi:hypothetical protein
MKNPLLSGNAFASTSITSGMESLEKLIDNGNVER